MLLEEVKKLKVTELRVKLKERGLDTKGLKAELVARLISAIKGEVRNTEETTLNEGKAAKESSQLATEAADVTVLNTEGRKLEEQKPETKESEHRSQCGVDQSTQTENDPTLHCPVSQSPCSFSEGSKDPVRHQQQQLTSNSPRLSTDPLPEVHCGSQEPSLPSSLEPAVVHDDVPASSLTVSLTGHTSYTTDDDQSSQRELDTLETNVDGQDEGGNIKRPHDEKGRDYYEFKEEIQYNRAKTPEPGSESDNEMEVDDDVVRLDTYNSDLHFEVGADGCSGQPLLWERFPLLRSGCRLTHGFTHGKVGFEVKFVKKLSAATVDLSFDPDPHVLRVGWSVDSTSFQLGEEELSFSLDGAGRTVTRGKVEDFGESFSEGDVIGCYAFISESGEAELSFHKNGHSLGVAFYISSSTLAGRALYPHILCKNCLVSLNLDVQGTVWYLGPPGFCPLSALPSTQRTRGPLPPPHRKDCEVLMMVGMPGAGKSHWAQKHMTKNPEKHYNVLSTNSILQCMRLPDSDHRELLLQQATQCLTHLIKTAANKRRNVILDQANIYPSARKHKMLRFHGYQRRAVVVVPSDAEWKRRLQRQHDEEGVEVPEMSLLKSKVSFTLPEQGDLMEEVLFVELCREEVQNLLTIYKEEARCLLPLPVKRKKRQNRHLKPTINPRGRAYGRVYHSCGHHLCCQSKWGFQKPYVWHPSPTVKPYGCNSDPQQYREYYQPCTGQGNTADQNQCYYSNQDYYFGSQVFWY
ncbi:heterogeneous nuclear ribonucleoprotein U-like protein 2 [Hoplias malabaricus]|uniref:heterogeneous nuclear ribonucleoprotein U-like protein 2 n=1 Tax=Hoplias malabaricus TaxID=27720 RepID=UPI00346367BE